MIKLLISCEPSDASPIRVCLEGLKAHSDVEFKEFEEVYVAGFPDNDALETFVHLMESIPFKHESFIRIVNAEEPPYQFWTLAHFHKVVLVDGLFNGKA